MTFAKSKVYPKGHFDAQGMKKATKKDRGGPVLFRVTKTI